MEVKHEGLALVRGSEVELEEAEILTAYLELSRLLQFKFSSY